VNLSAATLCEVPNLVVTVTCTVPLPAGLFAVTCAAEELTTVPFFTPKCTAVGLLRCDPEIVT
jgi:hypothetical protein